MANEIIQVRTDENAHRKIHFFGRILAVLLILLIALNCSVEIQAMSADGQQKAAVGYSHQQTIN